MKRIGYIDARRVNLPGKISIKSWGAIISQGYYLYMNDDYGASLASLASGYLDLIGSTGINLRVGAIGVLLQAKEDGIMFGVPLSCPTGIKMLATGELVLRITDEISTTEGAIWYDASEDKLKFRTAAATETITSA